MKSGKFNHAIEIAIENLKLHNFKTSKKVEKFDLKMNKLEEYNSIAELQKSNDIDRSGISKYLKSDKFKKGIPYKGFLYRIKSHP